MTVVSKLALVLDVGTSRLDADCSKIADDAIVSPEVVGTGLVVIVSSVLVVGAEVAAAVYPARKEGE